MRQSVCKSESKSKSESESESERERVRERAIWDQVAVGCPRRLEPNDPIRITFRFNSVQWLGSPAM